MKRAARLRRRTTPPASQGLTLLELLVAMSIVGILCAIAWPGYGAVLQRAHRTDARLALLRVQHLQESHYATHLRYARRLGGTADAETLLSASHSDDGSYALSLRTSEDGQRYTLSAHVRPQGRQARDHACAGFSVDETGTRRATNAAGADATAVCWR